MEQVLEDSNVFRKNEAEMALQRESKPFDMQCNETLMEALRQHESSFVISDPQLPDHPIVYASEGFCTMSGFGIEEVVGYKCRFLEGPDTDMRAIRELRDSMRDERSCRLRILNYTKHGKPMWNLFHAAPLYSRTDGRVVLYVGMYIPLLISLSDIAERFSDSLGVTCPKMREMAVGFFNGPLKLLMDTAARSVESATNTQVAQEPNYESEAGTGGKKSEILESWSPQSVANYDGTKLYKTQEADEQRARVAVMAVVADLTRHYGGNLTDRRGVGSTVLGVVCSSLLSLHRIKHSFVLVDPHLPDMPIVHANEQFLQLTGYTNAEVLGRNCRFLQGPDTDAESIQQIRDCVKAVRACTVGLLNYKKDGQPFWNMLHLSPVRNCTGKVAYYAGVQLLLTEADIDAHKKSPCAAKHLGTVAAIRVAVRGAGLHRPQLL
uniref:Putative LOV domain-containing protein n=1 Tax=Phaeomegaceros coriaceus TaxID=405431 RepID=A0A126WUY8_9EMBR|nr:putative LOV domain-containing protein [Phaeomegaceros coriaceus]